MAESCSDRAAVQGCPAMIINGRLSERSSRRLSDDSENGLKSIFRSHPLGGLPG